MESKKLRRQELAASSCTMVESSILSLIQSTWHLKFLMCWSFSHVGCLEYLTESHIKPCRTSYRKTKVESEVGWAMKFFLNLAFRVSESRSSLARCLSNFREVRFLTRMGLGVPAWAFTITFLGDMAQIWECVDLRFVYFEISSIIKMHVNHRSEYWVNSFFFLPPPDLIGAILSGFAWAFWYASNSYSWV